MITEAFPEDSGLFKCVAINPFGTVSCCAALEVYHGESATYSRPYEMKRYQIIVLMTFIQEAITKKA